MKFRFFDQNWRNLSTAQ